MTQGLVLLRPQFGLKLQREKLFDSERQTRLFSLSKRKSNQVYPPEIISEPVSHVHRFVQLTLIT